MMRLPWIGIAGFVFAFAVVHFAVLLALPEYIMSTARDRLTGSGLAVHGWQMSPRITPETQTIVRPSPDLAYTICLIDVSDGPVTLSVPVWPAYGSLSVFDEATNNVYAGSLDGRAADAPGMRTVIIALEGERPIVSDSADVVRIAKPSALALIRRLAPSQALYDAAAALVPASRCGP